MDKNYTYVPDYKFLWYKLLDELNLDIEKINNSNKFNKGRLNQIKRTTLKMYQLKEKYIREGL